MRIASYWLQLVGQFAGLFHWEHLHNPEILPKFGLLLSWNRLRQCRHIINFVKKESDRNYRTWNRHWDKQVHFLDRVFLYELELNYGNKVCLVLFFQMLNKSMKYATTHAFLHSKCWILGRISLVDRFPFQKVHRSVHNGQFRSKKILSFKYLALKIGEHYKKRNHRVPHPI